MPWPGVFRDDVLIFFQAELTPFVAPHVFVLMLIIRAARGWGCMPGKPAAWESKTLLPQGGFHQPKEKLPKEEEEESKGQQPLDGLCLSRGQNASPYSSQYREEM